MSSSVYRDTIWTNHALDRLTERGLSQSLAWKAFQYPDSEKRLDSHGSMEYKKDFGDYAITVIAKKNNEHHWVIISCWIDPPLPGSVDDIRHRRYLVYKKQGPLGKLWMQIAKYLLGWNF